MNTPATDLCADLVRDVIYLDNNATTRVDDAVAAAMLPFLTTYYGNPSSLHTFGAQVAARVESARAGVARLLGARESEIVFTSGGTEGDNAAMRGALLARPERRHVIITAVEHHAVIDIAEQLGHEGYSVDRVGVDRDGRLDLSELRALLRPDQTALVCAMLANNETGVVFPLREVADAAHAAGALVHTDAVNAAGKIAIDVEALGVDLLAISGHKVYAPKGVGALYVRRGTPLRPLLIGGPQERHRRGGTHNAPGIIALGSACELLVRELEVSAARIATLRGRLEAGLRERFPDILILGEKAQRLPNTTCACFEGVEAEALLLLLSEAGICASSGAACSSGSLEPSHVLKAMGIPPHVAQGQIRFSLGRFSTSGDVDRLLSVLPGLVARVAAVNVG